MDRTRAIDQRDAVMSPANKKIDQQTCASTFVAIHLIGLGTINAPIDQLTALAIASIRPAAADHAP